MDELDAIVSVALDLNEALAEVDRYGRLLDVLRRVIPYDAATLMRHEDGVLVPVAARGLSDDAMGRRYPVADHPRLAVICRSEEPVRFAADSPLADPFDGMILSTSGEFQRIHACLGCPLRVDGHLIGTLTADALAPAAFDPIEQRFLVAVGALAAAALRTTDLLDALERTAARQGYIAQDLMRDVQQRQGSDLLGTSAAMEHLRKEIDLVAQTDLTVLITGETGAGKELVARAIHAASKRHQEPMLYVNCAALPDTLAESELFGHAKGAFTGATSDRPGKFEIADGGTLFLDEIGELSQSVQPKLLRALQEGEVQRIGTEKPVQVDVRVIAATNRDLEREVARGRFRADLYHRIHVFSLHVPPLRERIDDLALLAGYFCDLARRQVAVGPVRLSPDAVDVLRRYPWPGNVRELKNVVSRATLKSAADVHQGEPVLITPRHLGPDFSLAPAPEPLLACTEDGPLPHGLSMKEAVREYQRCLIRRALERADGNWAAAARALGTHRSNLHHLAKRLGLK